MMPVCRSAIPAAVIALAAVASAAVAQTVTGKTVNAVSGKAVRLGVYAGMKKDCSPGPLPEVKIVTPPANGVFVVRRLRARINLPGRCPPNTEVPVQAAFYQSRAAFVGNDSVSYEVVSASGTKNSYTVAITVAPAPAPKRSPGAQDL
jgi:hypothetical protein